MSWHVRRINLSDEDALFAFREKIFPTGNKEVNRSYWRWKFVQNPYAEEIPFFILEAENRIVGTQGHCPVPVAMEGRQITCSFLVDFNVEDVFKGLPVVKLFRAVRSCSELNIGANLSDDARRFFGSARWLDLSSSLDSFYFFLRRPKKSPQTWWRYNISYLIRRFHHWRAAKKAMPFYTMQINDSIPEEVNRLWNFMRIKYKVSFQKDLAYLKWRYDKCPIASYHYASLYSEKSLKAFLVFTFQSSDNGQKCIIMDALYDPEEQDFLSILLAKVITYCQKQGCYVLETILSASSIKKLFLSVGFRAVTSDIGFMFHSKDKSLNQAIMEPDGLCFLLGDTDRY